MKRVALVLALTGCTGGVEPSPGGATTVVDVTREAFSQPASNLTPAHRAVFFVGNSFFNQNWVIAPAQVSTRDGLGPLFNQRSCSGCHLKDGRSAPPENGGLLETLVLRISAPHAGPSDDLEKSGAPADPVYGHQIQGDAIPGAKPEARVMVEYSERPGRFPDGERYSLRVPRYYLEALGYGAPSAGLSMSPRVAPSMIGLGLLEAVPAEVIERSSDPEDRDRDGISGRVNVVWDEEGKTSAPGRFGWKAEQPSILQQTAGAFQADIGISSALYPRENHSSAEIDGESAPSGGSPELEPNILEAIVLYARTLAVPARRLWNDAEVALGERLFEAARCNGCHVPTLETKTATGSDDLTELTGQTIHPYTDLLLHDMGEGLGDGRPTFGASGREWRTPPLWGLGLVKTVNLHTTLLHDGRARTTSEAILWHDGEARASREAFSALSRRQRLALVKFVESL